MNRPWTRLAALLAAFAISPLQAETVSVSGRAGGTGQGWLFGSPLDGECHVVVPAHLLQSRPGGALSSGAWRGGGDGEGRLIAPRRPPPPFDDASLDLAFARVDGIAAGRCLSRLGLLDASRTIERATEAVVLRRHASYGATMAFTLAGFDAERVQASPANDPARAAVANVKGLSGTTLRVETLARGMQPVGMIVRTLDGLAVATRFDLIRRAFLAEPAAGAPGDPGEGPEAGTAPTWKLVGADARSDDPTKGIDKLDNDGCWQTAPNEGRRSVDIEIETSAAGPLAIAFAAACGGPPDSAQLQRRVRTGWSAVADCPITDGATLCPSRHTGGERLRLVLVVRDGRRIGIESMQMEGGR